MNQQSKIEAVGTGFRIYTIDTHPTRLETVLEQLLPGQGAIEVQRDKPGKEHAWHHHDTDETLVILKGAVRFYWDGGETICGPGSVIALPSGMRHGSVALADGATYLIAFHSARLDHHD